MTDNNSVPEGRRSRRLSPRHNTHLEAYRVPEGLGPNIAVRVLDISPHGAQLALSEALPSGHVMGVAIYGPHLQPVAAVGHVIWCRPSDDGTFLVGVEFRSPVGADNVAALGRG
jgi:hypothetical protein